MNMLLQCLELAGLNLDMNDDLLHPAVEDPHKMAIPTCPDFSAGIFRRDRIVGLLDLDMTVTMDRTLGLLETREPACRKWRNFDTLI